MAGRRIEYIDIAKGILILCLLYGHMVIELNLHGVDDAVLHGMWKFVPVYNSFFMPCFFLITGFCSTFSVPFRRFLWKNVKTLLIPAVIITLIGQYGTDIFNCRKLSFNHFLELGGWLGNSGPWFILSLFISKMIYRAVSGLKGWQKASIVTVFYFGGLVLDRFDFFPNYMWHRHAFILLPFLYIGDVLKTGLPKVEKFLKPAALAWLFLVPLQVVLHYRGICILPTLDKSILVTLDNFYLHFANVLLGTAMIFQVSRWLQAVCKSDILRTFGTGTLLIYLINEPQQRFVLRIMMPFYSPDFSILQSVIFQVSAHLLCFIIFYWLVKVVYDSRYLSKIVGKW